MALEIKSPPVLRGKVAVEFYERWSGSSDSTSKEVARESMRKTMAILAKYDNPYKNYVL